MANFKIEDYFTLRSVNPSSMTEGNIIQFASKSPRGVHDQKPLVLVHERQGDRFYGINFNYDMRELNEAVTNLENSLLPFLEKEYFKKYPENKQKLNETHQKFNKSLITEAEYHEMMRRFPPKQLEVFQVNNKDMEACRCYRYDRMTAVSKLLWKA